MRRFRDFGMSLPYQMAPPFEARRDDIQTVLGFMAPAAATWVADASRIDDVLARRP